MELVLKISLSVLIVISLLPLSAFAEPSIELSADQKQINPSESFLVFGKVMGVAPYSTVNLSVVAPDDEIVYSFNVKFDGEGNFKRLIHPPLPSFKPGVYTVIASHEQVGNAPRLDFTVIDKDVPRGILQESESLLLHDKTMSDMYIIANAVEGDTEISIVGKTVWPDRDITLKVSSPNGNLIAVAQVTPTTNGDFSTKLQIGGPMWKEDGMYTVAAYQGDISELQDTVKVDIANGMVVPEFGTIAAMILAVSIISLIVFSTKSRLRITPKL